MLETSPWFCTQCAGGSGKQKNDVRSRSKKNVFHAERILGRRTLAKGSVEYLVKWYGFEDRAATWEPRENILSEKLISDFEAQKSREEELRASKRRKVSLKKIEVGDFEETKKFGFQLLDLSDSATGKHWCIVAGGGSEPLPRDLEAGDLLVEIDGRDITCQLFENTLSQLAQIEDSASFVFERP
mmetsp:Transcript_58811/g.133125  ORF Transcript_58811/g.133125 Transcript_58811/m.133125 type:complete len:185 (-) Transcript_58811:129-683(-)